MAVGAAKLNTNAGTVWCHLSSKGDSYVLRRYTEGVIFEVEASREDIEDFVPKKDCEKYCPNAPNGYSFKEYDVWATILQKLESGKVAPTKASSKRATAQKIKVPITELRQFYDFMKLLDDATYVGFTETFLKTPKSIERFWSKSYTSFSSYNNKEGWGDRKRKDLPKSPKKLEDVGSTDEFTAFLLENDPEGKDIGYTIVDREINPWRTTGGVFSNKLPASKSGSGGIDLLLKSTESGLPVVGEVKVENDSNAFYALIQAMTYAVELSTMNQLKRLKKHIPGLKEVDLNNAAVEIAIIKVNPDPDKTLENVISLIRKLNKRNNCSGLARITLLKNNGKTWTKYS